MNLDFGKSIRFGSVSRRVPGDTPTYGAVCPKYVMTFAVIGSAFDSATKDHGPSCRGHASLI
jgi:hypothetical protein